MFTQILDPTGNLFLTWLVALIPVVLLLFLLAGLRMSAWLAVLIGSIVTFLLGLWVWKMPLDDGIRAYLYGSATGVWNVDWITFWGVMLFNTLVTTGAFDKLRRWLIQQGTRDVRVQTILFAWAFGALLEGLVGFGYPWAFVAPILITLGIPALDAIRVAAIANNAPVSYGALGAPIIALAAVTGMPLLALAGSVGKIVAILALLPPWILLYLVSGKQGMWAAWPLAIVGSLGYIAGQLPTAIYLGPYLPDVIGAIVCFACLLHPAEILAAGADARLWRRAGDGGAGSAGRRSRAFRRRSVPGLAADHRAGRDRRRLDRTVVAAAGDQLAASCGHRGVLDHAGATITAAFDFKPFVGGSAILASWIVVALLLRVSGARSARSSPRPGRRCGAPASSASSSSALPYVFNYSGMAGSLAKRVLQARAGLHRRGAAARLHRRRAVRQQYLDQRHVRQVPGAGRATARLPADAAADLELGRRRDRQADRAANRERRRVDQRIRPQRRRGHPPQFRLDVVLLVYLVLIGVACYLFFPDIAALPKA